jgi:hypothetical protein
MRKFVMLMLLTLVLSIFAPVMAQEDAVFCGTLSADDCAILEQSATAMADLSSAAAELNVQIDVENIPDTPNININLSGTAAYNVDMAAMEGMASEGLEGEAALEAITTALSGFDGELDLTLTLPEDIAAAGGLPASEINLQLALVDGVGYINFDPLDSLAGGALSAQGFTGWGGINFIDVINQVVAQNPEALDQLNMGAGATAAMDPAALAAVEGLAQYISIERQADVDGAAVFVTNIDFGGAVSDPAFQDLIQQAVAASGQTMDDAEFQQALGVLQLVGNDVTLSSTQYIDPSTGYVLRGELNFSLDLTTLLAASGQTVDGESIVSLVATIDYSGQNATEVTAPEGATIAPSEMVLQMLGGMGGSGF